MEHERAKFGTWDYVVFSSVLAISSTVGVYYRLTGGQQRTFKEFLLADQKMPVLPVAFSLMASFMSAITLLGVSMEIYKYGTQFIAINISYILSTPIVAYLYLPVFYNLRKVSVYEYLECRFGKVTRLCASVAFTLQMFLYMGIVLFAPALALSLISGISETVSVIVVGVICVFYSTLGGMKAVLITDVFQSLLMFAAILAVIFKGLMDYGIRKIFETASAGERIEFLNISVDPRVRHTVWNLGIGGIFTYCSLYGVNQAQVQRLLSVRSLRLAQAALWLQWPILMLLSLLTSFTGLVLYTHYQNCDPIQSKQIKNSDQILPFYVLETMGHIPGLVGLFASGIFSGSLSTISSAVNSLTAVILHDYIIPLFFESSITGERTMLLLNIVLSLFCGSICITLAFLMMFIGTGVLQASLTIFGAVGGPLLAVFTLGMSCHCANQKGVVTGLILGLTLTLWIGFGQPKPKVTSKPMSISTCPEKNISMAVTVFSVAAVNTSLQDAEGSTLQTSLAPIGKDGWTESLHQLYAVSYMWVAAVGFLTTFTTGFLVSLIFGSNRSDLNSALFFSVLKNIKRERNFEDKMIDVCASETQLSIREDVATASTAL